MRQNEKPKSANQNMTMNRPYTAPFLTSLALIGSPESQLSIVAKLVKNGAIYGRFMYALIFMFLLSFWLVIILVYPDAPDM